MSCMTQNFRLFLLSNLSVLNFRIFLLMYSGLLFSYTPLEIAQHSNVGANGALEVRLRFPLSGVLQAALVIRLEYAALGGGGGGSHAA